MALFIFPKSFSTTSPKWINRHFAIYLLSVSIPLLICTFVCIFYRVSDTNINLLLHTFFPSQLNDLRHFIQLKLPANDLLIYNLPEALWVFSLTLLSSNLFLTIKKHQFSLAYLPLIYIFIAEFLQFAQLTDGTFDYWDILCACIAWGFAYTLLLLLPPSPLFFKNKKLQWRWFIVILCSVYMADLRFMF